MTNVHGGTIRVFVGNKNNFNPKKHLEKFLISEQEFGINELETYKKFSNDVEQLKVSLIRELEKLKKEKKIIFGYGSPAKGNVLLNYCKIDTKFLDFIIDTTPLKQGLYTPGTHIPVKPIRAIKENESIQIAFLLAWNYEKEILEKENQFRNNGGKFLIPIPSPRIV